MTTSTLASPNLKVLTFNVGGLSPFGKITSPDDDKRLRSICLELGKQDYDVVLLQEVWTKGYRKLFKKCGYPYSLSREMISGLEYKWKRGLLTLGKLKLIARSYATLFPKNYGFDTGLMILSKFPLVEAKLHRFLFNGIEDRAFKDGEFPVNKGALGAVVRHPDMGDLFVVNTHLVSNYEDENYVSQRRQQLTEIVKWIDSHKAGRPVIFGGDFNISPPGAKGGARTHNTHLLWDELRYGFLKDYRQAQFPFPHMSTYIGTEGSDEGVLDHIFSNGLRAKDGSLAFTSPIPCGKKLCLPSDHYGLVTTFY